MPPANPQQSVSRDSSGKRTQLARDANKAPSLLLHLGQLSHRRGVGDVRNGRPLAAPRVLFAQGPGLPDQPLAPAASARREQHVERRQRFCSARGGRLQVGPGKEGGGQLAAKPRLLGRALIEIPAEDADKESSEPKRRSNRGPAQRQRRVQGLAGACPRSNDSPALQEAFLAPARSFWRAEPDLDVALPQKDDWAEAGVDLQHALGQDSTAVLRRQHRAELRGAEAAAAPQAQSLEDRRPRLGLAISHLATARETTLATAVGPRQYLNNAFASSVEEGAKRPQPTRPRAERSPPSSSCCSRRPARRPRRSPAGAAPSPRA